MNEEVFLKFNVTPYTVLLYGLLKVPAVENDLKLPSYRCVVRKIRAFSVFLKSTLCELYACSDCRYFLVEFSAFVGLSQNIKLFMTPKRT